MEMKKQQGIMNFIEIKCGIIKLKGPYLSLWALRSSGPMILNTYHVGMLLDIRYSSTDD